jgi:hypothetical protein
MTLLSRHAQPLVRFSDMKARVAHPVALQGIHTKDSGYFAVEIDFQGVQDSARTLIVSQHGPDSGR